MTISSREAKELREKYKFSKPVTKAAPSEGGPTEVPPEPALSKSQEAAPERRRKKKNFGIGNQKMAVPEMPGYALRWVNDAAGRIHQMQSNDWEFVDQKEYGDAAGAEILNTDLGTRISLVVGTQEDGSPLRAYLMKIRKEWYEEDQKEKQKPLDDIDREIGSGRFMSGSHNYTPQHGVKITTSS